MTLPVRERDFQQAVLDAARYLGWHCVHQFDSRRTAPGWPDVVCCREGRMVAIELKGPRGKVSPHQAFWIDLLGTVPGVTAMIAFPDDWPAIEAALKGINR